MEINKFPQKDIETLDSLEQRVNKGKENGKEHENVKGKEKEESKKTIQEIKQKEKDLIENIAPIKFLEITFKRKWNIWIKTNNQTN